MSEDKFISINYRHADNSRHTVQIEQFYIDALIAIGITDISKFVAENAGFTQVTRNVKRSIVNELVKKKQPVIVDTQSIDEKVYAILNEIEPAIKLAIAKVLQQ
jgi:hypothetical protein